MDSSVHNKENTADPFAEDIFSVRQSADEIEIAEDILAEAEVQKPCLWFQQLPKALPDRIDWSNLLRNLPTEFFSGLPHHLSEKLAEFLILPDKKNVEFLFLVKSEVKQFEQITEDHKKSLWLTLRIEGGESQIAFEIDHTFAVWLVDSALGIADDSQGRILRQITPSEFSVLEFLALNLILEANRFFQSPIFQFHSISSEIPHWLKRNFDSKKSHNSLLQLNYQTIHRLLPSIVRIYLAPQTLEALQPTENLLLDKRSIPFATEKLLNLVKYISMRASFGNTELSVAEFVSLETGDVVLLEDHKFQVRGENLSGRLEVFVGADENTKITGRLSKPDLSSSRMKLGKPREDGRIQVQLIDLKREWQIKIDKFVKEENQITTKNVMKETENELTEESKPVDDSEPKDERPKKNLKRETKGLSVENLTVNLRVELDARRLSLTEVSNLRESQILELGIRPTDSVNILIDNRTIGRGELVAVEDRLGVRITKLLR